jgi:arabinogalactan endo-1,4-beta-galactosidase
MVGISKINNIDICLLENMEHSGPTNVTDVINAVTEEVAKETGVNYIRLTHLPDDYFADYYHLLPEGHAYKAKEIFKYLIENKSQIFNKK